MPTSYPTRDEAFRNRLRTARERVGKSQADVAAEMQAAGYDFHQQTVYKIEAGLRRVTVGEALALAEAVHYSVESLAETRPEEHEAVMREMGERATQYVAALVLTYRHAKQAHERQRDFTNAVAELNSEYRIDLVDGADGAKTIAQMLEGLTHFDGPIRFIEGWRKLRADPGTKQLFDTIGFGALEDEIDG